MKRSTHDNSEVKAAKINAFAVITAAIITGILGTWLGSILESNKGQVTLNQTFYEIIDDGDNSDITLEEIKQNYIQLQFDYDTVEQQNQALAKENTSVATKLAEANEKISELQNQTNQEIEDLKSQIEVLESQLKSMPIVDFKNLSMCIDIDDISINTNNSAVTIEGRDYFSREIVENLIPDNKNLTIKDGTIFIGKVISEKANLFEQHCLDSNGINMANIITDSYGNDYSNVLLASAANATTKYIIYTLDRKYTLLKLSLAISDNAKLSSTGILTIKADERVVYTSKKLDKITEPFSILDVPIDNCSRLTIEYTPSYYSVDCIILDAVVYN